MYYNPPKSPKYLCIRRIVGILAFLSLSLPLISCQTLQEDENSKEKELIETHKAIVQNSLNSARPNQAHAELRPLLREFPKDATLHNLMGLVQLNLKNPTRAALHFKTSFKLDPLSSTGLNLSSAYIENGEFKNADNILIFLLKRKEAKPYRYRERLLHNLGYSYLKRGNTKKAEQQFKKALEENPAYYISLIELAKIYDKTKRPAMARETYKHAMDYCHICYEPVKALAMSFAKDKNKSYAKNTLIKFLKTEGISSLDKKNAGKLLKILERK